MRAELRRSSGVSNASFLYCSFVNVFSYVINHHYSIINPFHATGFFQYLLRTSENQRFTDVLKGYWKYPVVWNGLKGFQLSLNHQRPMVTSYRNQSIGLLFKSVDWFQYEKINSFWWVNKLSKHIHSLSWLKNEYALNKIYAFAKSKTIANNSWKIRF